MVHAMCYPKVNKKDRLIEKRRQHNEYVDGEYILFASEADYYEFMEEAA